MRLNLHKELDFVPHGKLLVIVRILIGCWLVTQLSFSSLLTHTILSYSEGEVSEGWAGEIGPAGGNPKACAIWEKTDTL